MPRTARRSGSMVSAMLAIAVWGTGCAGPMKLKRGLDEKHNQLYINSPLVAEALVPLSLVGDLLATAVDYLIVNPVFWWKDALRGRGTPYYYKNPEVPPEE